VLGDMLELGPQEEQYHLQIGEGLDADKIDYLFTFGTLGKDIAKGASKVLGEQRVFAYTNKEELIQKLEQYVDEATLVLVKASRGMKLEEIVMALQIK
jgi:UDP-N-acetylmuramoyl-tripeptide--D-alanyl-D-alanine ligase